jgi:hypothetical protein
MHTAQDDCGAIFSRMTLSYLTELPETIYQKIRISRFVCRRLTDDDVRPPPLLMFKPTDSTVQAVPVGSPTRHCKLEAWGCMTHSDYDYDSVG